MTAHLIAVEITGVVDDPDLLDAIVRNLLAEGLAQYREQTSPSPLRHIFALSSGRDSGVVSE